ncbi:hypothetical protein GWI33_000746 [Rhynchophorus ferrugineus]|uniref:Uncharacterized protein n=1 Tax=Rhynchophorus ferrugineus TaxID=354439 RepID=A0A834M3S5_RHYFE|nr:hypothetical protein GWI33_000746 [Rhynchophorus ferrugineus]
MIGNTFTYMKSGALEKISPGLIQDSGRNFGKLKFFYDFSKNVIKYVDSGGLHPDYPSYVNVQTEMMFKNNELGHGRAKLGKNKLYESGYPMFGRGSLGRGNSAIQLRRVETLKDRYADVFYGRPDKSWSSARSRGPEKLERLEWPR